MRIGWGGRAESFSTEKGNKHEREKCQFGISTIIAGSTKHGQSYILSAKLNSLSCPFTFLTLDWADLSINIYMWNLSAYNQYSQDPKKQHPDPNLQIV